MNEATHETERRLTRVETLVGEDPESGIRGDIHTLFKVLRAMERRIYMAIGGGMVIFWMVQKYGK